MSVCRNWIRHVLTASSLAALVATVPAAAIASDAIAHPEGTLKLASHQLVSGSTVQIRGEMFAERGKLQLLLVGVAGLALDNIQQAITDTLSDRIGPEPDF